MAFKSPRFSVAAQPREGTPDELGNANAFRRCPPDLGYGTWAIALRIWIFFFAAPKKEPRTASFLV